MIITNKHDLPQQFVELAKSDYKYKPKQYSVTALLKGTREIVLQRRHHEEIEMDVSEMVWMLFGQAVHSMLEKEKESDTELKEEYLIAEVSDGYKLSGMFDLYDAETQMITDYKTASVWKIMHKDFEDWRKQGLMYAWLLKQAGFSPNSFRVVAFLKDHSKSKAQRDAQYPDLPVYTDIFQYSQEDFAEIEAFIYQKFKEIKLAESLPDEKLPMCTPEERWYTGDRWAVMKKGRKSALRVLGSEGKAYEWMSQKGKGEYVEYRPGENRKCDNYCSVKSFCKEVTE